MSLKKVTSPEKNISVLELHIDKAAFDDAVMKSYKKKRRQNERPRLPQGQGAEEHH